MTQSIYIELDVLLDTRLATLIRLDEDQAVAAFDKGYRDRQSDQWHYLGLDVDQDRYDELYRQRDKDTLKLARPTAALMAIPRILEDLYLQSQVGPGEEETTLFINYYPYRFDSDREVEAIRQAIIEQIGTHQEVSMGRFAPNEMTPSVIDQNWAALFIYNFNEWLHAQVENLKSYSLISTTFVTPALYWNKVPESEEDTYIEQADACLSPFAALELVLTEFLGLHMLDPRLFSIVDLDVT